MIQTPFGNLPNPRAQQQQPNMPLSSPGQSNGLFPNSNAFPPQAQPVVPAAPNGQPTNAPFNNPNPFGNPTTIQQPTNPFGTPPQNNPPTGLFGSQPPVFSNPGNQQR
jgi:hypothetical protein